MSNSISIRQHISALRDAVRERREARASYDALKQDLASFQTRREVDDLLGLVQDQEGLEAQQIRDILLDNVRPTVGLGRI